LDELLNQIQNGDTLIVTKLDRIARSTKDGLDIIDTLLSKGVNIEILNMGKFDNTPVGKLMRTVFFAFAEFERDMIVERTSEGKAIAKQKEDYTEGRPKKELPDFEKILKKQKDGELTITAACQILGISRTQWYRLVS
jgi:DNA invertase Pin-like site-specific DNA recombinase